jgi:hypothetical protein
MTSTTPTTGGAAERTRASVTARSTIRYGDHEGQACAFFRTPSDYEFILVRDYAEELIACGLKLLQPSYRSNGHGGRYLKVNGPKPLKGKAKPHEVARLVICLAQLREEATTGVRATRDPWKVRYLNGNRLDLRKGNLQAVPCTGREADCHTLDDLRRRRAKVARGLNPNPEYAARRKQLRAHDRARKAAERSAAAKLLIGDARVAPHGNLGE